MGHYRLDLGNAAAVITLAIGMVGLASLLYYLIDLLLVFFLGIVVAAALQPWHVGLVHLGIPKGLAVLLIYLLFAVIIALIALFVGPVLVTQISDFAAHFPEQYANVVTTLQASPNPMLQRLGNWLPSFEALTRNIADVSPAFLSDLLTFMSSTVSFFVYFVLVFAIAFYWTIELPRFERLAISLLPVSRRAQVLNIWHEIELSSAPLSAAKG